MATKISENLYFMVGHVPGIEIAGRQRHPLARVTILHHEDTLGHPHIQEMDRTDLDRKLRERIPALGKKISYRALDLGRLGLEAGTGLRGDDMIAMGADLGTSDKGLATDRGEQEAVMCELNDWLPVRLEPINFTATFARVPADSCDTRIEEVEKAVRLFVPSDLRLWPLDYDIGELK